MHLFSDSVQAGNRVFDPPHVSKHRQTSMDPRRVRVGAAVQQYELIAPPPPACHYIS